MKTMTRLASAALAGLALVTAGPSLMSGKGFSLIAEAEARTRVSVSFGVFYDNLRPYGQWVRHGRYGQVWVPAHQRNWRPYTRGRWAMTNDYGWMWVSDEPFGWATYHYGSWDYDSRLGWYWVPGYVWGPAWVTWSDRGDYIGWAPIPASYLWGDAFNDFFYYRPVIRIEYRDSWCYAPTRHFGDRHIDRHVVRPRDNVTIINNNTTVVNNTNITNVTIIDNRVYNGGVPVVAVNAVADTPVETVQVTDATAPTTSGDAAAPGVVAVYRPVETPIADDPAVIQDIATQQQTEAATADGNPQAPVDIPGTAPETIDRPVPATSEVPVDANTTDAAVQPEQDAFAPVADPLPPEAGFGDQAVPLQPEAPVADQPPADQPSEQSYADPGMPVETLPQPDAAPSYDAPVEAPTADAPVEQSYADPSPSYDAPAADPVYEQPSPETLPAPDPQPSYDAPVEAPVEQSYADPAPQPAYEQPAETYSAPEPEPSYEAPQAQENYAAPEPAYEAPAPAPEPAYEPPPAPVYEPPPAPEPPPPPPAPPPSSETTDQQ